MKNSIKCRLCGANLQNRICFLQAMPLTDEFVSVDEVHNELIRDIDIYQCGECGLVQNPIDFDYEDYYKNYEYSSGHSDFARSFMRAYALEVCDAFRSVHGRDPTSVLEIGSGDGEQLRAFQELGVAEVLGIEPSDALARRSESVGVPAYKGLFSLNMIHDLPRRDFDICLSSYTLDHVRSPVDYMRAAHRLLVPGGVLAFEVHDLSRISERGEWCLFEHEHTIYMDADMARRFVHRNRFQLRVVNPLPEAVVRANSLIVIATKTERAEEQENPILVDYSELQKRIDLVAERIDGWISALPPGDELVGYGAGGRGIMTLALLSNAARFSTLFDTNYSSGRYFTPKTRITVSGRDRLADYRSSWCMVFSFGYMKEIKANLIASGYRKERIISLVDFMYNS